MPRENLSQIKARLRKKLEDRRAATAVQTLPMPNMGAPPPPPLPMPNMGPPPLPPLPKPNMGAPPPPPMAQRPASPPDWSDSWSAPAPNWKGVGSDGYEPAISDVKRSLRTQSEPGDERLRRACEEWTQQQYDPGRYTAVLDALQTTKGDLANRVNSALMEGGKPKLRSEGGCWTWNLDDNQHRMAVDSFKEAKLMAANTANLLTNADPSIKPSVDQLFGQYFGQEAKPGKDAPGSEVATPQKLAQNLSATLAGMQAGNFVLCGPSSTTMFETDKLTAAVADPDKKNITYLSDRFFRPEQRNDPTTPGGLKKYEQMLIGAETILHEATHQFANTKDVTVDGREKCYGRTDCKQLPGNYAAANADSMALLAMDLSVVTKFGGQMDSKQKESLINAGTAPPKATAATSGESSGT